MLYAYERCIWSLCKKWNILRSSTATYIQFISFVKWLPRLCCLLFRCNAHERMWIWFLEFFQFPPETGKFPILFSRFLLITIDNIHFKNVSHIKFSFLVFCFDNDRKKSNKRAACIFIFVVSNRVEIVVGAWCWLLFMQIGKCFIIQRMYS